MYITNILKRTHQLYNNSIINPVEVLYTHYKCMQINFACTFIFYE